MYGRSSVAAADSIVGVTYFSQASPDDFGAFNKAFVALFRITAGDAWIESLPAYGPEGGLNPGSVVFQVTYVLIVNWTLLPIRWDGRTGGWGEGGMNYNNRGSEVRELECRGTKRMKMKGRRPEVMERDSDFPLMSSLKTLNSINTLVYFESLWNINF